MPLSPTEAEAKTKEYESITINKLIVDYSKKIDDFLSTTFSNEKDKFQITLVSLKGYSKVIQDAVLESLKKDYEHAGWKVWHVQEKSSSEFCFTLEIQVKKEQS